MLLVSEYFCIFYSLGALFFPLLHEHTGNLQPLILPVLFSVYLDISDPLSHPCELLDNTRIACKMSKMV